MGVAESPVGTVGGVVSGARRRGNAPCLDFGDAGVAGERAGDVYPNPVGGERSEAYSALDQIVSAYRSKRDPGRSIPALDCKAGYAISVKG